MFLFCFFSGNVGSLKTQLLKKNTKTRWQRKKKDNRERLGRGILNTCAKLQGLPLKYGVDIGL